ncbi:hypothetical protein A3747_10820 [Sulfitobacter sp. HI0076]|nr:hypothetical protein A3720_16575 [Sulfitobacter sp. HI0021]KZY01618.1 hypothetical protein A3722_07850 [Sulfitobacter sp. HI0027]KZZ03650.1 hypothetical protein A3747_10820 [Sulfitobacter sp. HI0076]
MLHKLAEIISFEKNTGVFDPEQSDRKPRQPIHIRFFARIYSGRFRMKYMNALAVGNPVAEIKV